MAMPRVHSVLVEQVLDVTGLWVTADAGSGSGGSAVHVREVVSYSTGTIGSP